MDAPSSNFIIQRLLYCFIIFLIGNSAARDARDSVVQIDTETTSGYGFAWEKTDQIVTVLHLVAGKNERLVHWKGDNSSATVVAINQAADLAILQLDKPLGVPPMSVLQGVPARGVTLDFWETPNQSTDVNNKTLLLNSVEGSIPLRNLDRRITDDAANFEKNLCTFNQMIYPSLDVKVFKFEDRKDNPKIKESHSGSPVTYKDNIIGIVDGGLNGAKPVRWVINAAENLLLPRFVNYNPQSGSVCKTDKLYGGIREDNPLRYTVSNTATPGETETSSTIFLEFRASFGDMYDMLPEEEISMLEHDMNIEADLSQKIEGYDPVKYEDLFREQIDVYEDYKTGAIICIPVKTIPEFSNFDQGSFMAEVTEEELGDSIEMIIQIERCESVEKSREAIEWFWNYVTIVGDKNLNRWKLDTQYSDTTDWLDDPEDPYYEAYLSCDSQTFDEAENEFKDDGGTIYANLSVNNTIFLGNSIKNEGNLYNLTKEKRIQYYMMQVCVAISGFAYY